MSSSNANAPPARDDLEPEEYVGSDDELSLSGAIQEIGLIGAQVLAPAIISHPSALGCCIVNGRCGLRRNPESQKIVENDDGRCETFSSHDDFLFAKTNEYLRKLYIPVQYCLVGQYFGDSDHDNDATSSLLSLFRGKENNAT
jgi:hypothetical protein